LTKTANLIKNLLCDWYSAYASNGGPQFRQGHKKERDLGVLEP
jgi:hypothetical protein